MSAPPCVLGSCTIIVGVTTESCGAASILRVGSLKVQRHTTLHDRPTPEDRPTLDERPTLLAGPSCFLLEEHHNL